MKILESLIVALSMYSKIPMPQIEWNKENMRYALCFFPAAGAAVGIDVYKRQRFIMPEICICGFGKKKEKRI